MSPLHLVDPPLVPTPDGAHDELRRELLRPGYYDRSLVQRLLDALDRAVSGSVDSARGTGPLTWFAATVVVLALVAALVLLLSRARRTARVRRGRADVLGGRSLGSAELRRRAELALAQGRAGEAVLEAFRALVVRQVERGRLDDRPGATAAEVARDLGGERPDAAERLRDAAALFDAVLYGHREPGADRARDVLALEALLDARVGAREPR